MIKINLINDATLYQWDTKRKLKISGKANIEEVHFSTLTSNNALVVTPKDNIVNIPSVLLQTGEDILVYLVEVDGDSKQIVAYKELNVCPRAKPDDYIYTEDEIFSYDKLEEQLGLLEKGAIKDIQIDNKSIVNEEKIVNIPVAADGALGVVKTGSFGIKTDEDGALKIDAANKTDINEKNQYKPITANNLEYAVQMGLISNEENLRLNEQEKEIVRNKLGTVGFSNELHGEVFNDYENNTASGEYSHAEGIGTNASGSYQHVQGKWNAPDTESKYAHIVGNGDSNARSNAHTVDWNGNGWFAGKVTIGPDNKELATKDDIATGGGKDEVYVGSGEMPEGYILQIDPTEKASGIIEDVKIDGASIITDGVANIPVATNADVGLVKGYTYYGHNINSSGAIMHENPTKEIIDGRRNYYPLSTSMIDYAVKQALTDGKGEAYTSDEQQAARERIGAITVTDIPIASKSDLGVVKTNDNFGIRTNANGEIYVFSDKSFVNNRKSYHPLAIGMLDYAVKAALTDDKGAAYTSEEKASARSRLGLEWKLIDTIEVAEEVAQAQIDFPQDYSEFMVIADIKGNGTSVVYPVGGYFNKDEPNQLKGYNLPFTDFYPSTNDEHYELIFEKMNIENDTFLKVSGFESKGYLKKMKQNIQSTGWVQHYTLTNIYPCHCWYGVKFQRTITNATFKVYAR